MVSLKPKDQQKADLWEGGPATINTVRAVMFDYGGTTDETPCIHVNCTAQEDDKERDVYYSVGDAGTWEPSEDGLKFVAKKKGRTGLNDNCNGAHFINSLVAAGFPEDDLDENLDIFDDMDVVFVRKPQPERKITEKDGKESKGGKTFLLVSEITRMPGEKAKPTAKGKPATGKAAPAAAPAKSKKKGGDDENIEKLQDAITEILDANDGGPVTKKKIGQLVFVNFKKDPDVKALTAMAADDDFLGDDARPWTYDSDEETLSK